MKKQDNESLIQEVTKRLDWYTMEASDEEFDADEVQTLLKLLDSLKGEEKEEELPVEEALDSFWKYCEKRQEEERILAADGKESDENHKNEPEKKEGRMHHFLWYFHKHRIAVVTAVALIIIMLGGSWQMAVNAEKHGGFFWWMDKNEEGTTLITAPEEGRLDSGNQTEEKYYNMKDVPEKYREYTELPCRLKTILEYTLQKITIVKAKDMDMVCSFYKNQNNEEIQFWVKIYPRQILRVRETYPGFIFSEEFEDEGINFDVFLKEEQNKNNSYIVYFYYGNEKYIVFGENVESLKTVAIDYKNAVIDNDKK